MSRHHSHRFWACAWCFLIITGCVFESDDGTRQRVPPAAGVDTTQIDYSPVSPAAIHHFIRGESLPQLSAVPEDLPSLREIRTGSEHQFEGRFNVQGLKHGTLRIQFFQMRPKGGRVITQEAGAGLTQDGEYYKYRVPVTAPVTFGPQEAELQFIEFHEIDPTDPQHERITVHVIAKSTVKVIK